MRDGTDLSPSSTANPSRQRSRAHRLARCFAGRPPEGHLIDTDLPHTALRARLVPSPPLSCNSSVTAIAIPRACRAHPLARWHRFVSIEHREPLQTALQGTSARAMISRKLAELTQNCHTRPSEPSQTGQSPIPHFPAIHLARQWPFHGPPGHISSRDGTDLCPSSEANPSRHRSKAYRPARRFAGSSPNRHLPAAHGQKRPRTATHPSREHGHLGRTLR